MTILEKLRAEVAADRAAAAAAEKAERERRQKQFDALADRIAGDGEGHDVTEVRRILAETGFSESDLANRTRERQEERTKETHLARLRELETEALATMAEAAAKHAALETELRTATDFAGAVLEMCSHVKQFGYSSTLITFLREAKKQK